MLQQTRSIKIFVMGLDKDELDLLANSLFVQWETINLTNHPPLNTNRMVKWGNIKGESPVDEVGDERKQQYSSHQSGVWKSPCID